MLGDENREHLQNFINKMKHREPVKMSDDMYKKMQEFLATQKIEKKKFRTDYKCITSISTCQDESNKSKR